ncbi:MAG: DNA-packaging protein [Kiloniellaceae bacterium]
MPENASLAKSLASLPDSERKKLLRSLTTAEAENLDFDWRFWARPNQVAPAGDWTTWLVLAGRGFGKTRCGAEWVRAGVCGATPLSRGTCRRVALVAETAADARDVMVEGESGLLAVHPPGFRPLYQPSKRRLTWPNGAVATLYNAVEPDQLRGPQHDLAWADELAKWRHAQATWNNLQFGLRLGARPRQCVTTTPRPIRTLTTLIEDPDTVITRGSSYENMANLAPAFIKRIIRRYEGTRLGRQELNGELLEDVPGALWTRARIDELRRRQAPEMKRIVVAIDPAAGSGETNDETGIIVAGLGADGHGYVLEDVSLRARPHAWGRAAVNAYRRWGADRIVGEVNNGGEMIEHVIRTVDPNVSYKAVRASRGKAARAEPVAALDEQGRVHHVGAFPELEDQMCALTVDPGSAAGAGPGSAAGAGPGSAAGAGFERAGAGFSPDRVDARVWALTELMLGPAPGEPRIRVL